MPQRRGMKHTDCKQRLHRIIRLESEFFGKKGHRLSGINDQNIELLNNTSESYFRNVSAMIFNDFAIN